MIEDTEDILVTGANGFIGRHLCRELLRQNKQVLGLVRSLSGIMEYGRGIKYIAVPDITEKCDRVFRDKNIKTVVHLAAKVHVMPGKGDGDEADYRRVNTEGTLCLAAEAAKKNVKRFVFVSSIKVNGEYTEHAPFKASDPPAPQDAYAQSKFLAEEGLKKIAAETGMELVIIRPPMVYGPGAGGNFGKLLKKIRSGWYFPLAGVKNKRSLVFVGNLVDLICICLASSKAAGNTFLVSDDHDVSTPELIEILAENSGRKNVLFYFPPLLLQLIGRIFGKEVQLQRLLGSLQIDCGSTKEKLSWRPPFSFKEGISRSIL